MRLIELEIENVKRIKMARINPQGNLFCIGGRNDQGKTSVLDSAEMLLAGKRAIPARPVRLGQEEGRIAGVLGEIAPNGDMLPEFFVERKIKPNGDSVLVLRDKDGGVLRSPQRLLDDLVSKFSFDPMKFDKLEPAKQKQLLLEITGLTGELEKIEAQRLRHYSERTEANRNADLLDAQVRGIPYHDKAPKVEVSAGEISEKLVQANQFSSRRAQLEQFIEQSNAALVRCQADLEHLQKQIHNTALQVEGATAELQSLPVVDLTQLRSQLENINNLNEQVRNNAQREQLTDTMRQWRTKANEATTVLEKIDAHKAQVLASVVMPIPGLSFDETGPTHNGVPFEQISKSNRILISAAIGRALHPELNILLFRDGEGLDEDNLTVLENWANENDLSIWLERVGKGEECSIIIEDGEVERQQPVYAATEEDGIGHEDGIRQEF